MKIDFEKITDSSNIPLTIRELYLYAFPEEERRPWDDICRRIDSADPFLSFYVLQHSSENIGFLTLWRLPHALYCEHFAILPQFRGQGFGFECVKEMIAQAKEIPPHGSSPLVLEVELPEKSEEAARRIGFYQRCGLQPLNDFPYWQPPYRRDLPEVPMMLMCSAPLADPASFVIMLHTLVYNQ